MSIAFDVVRLRRGVASAPLLGAESAVGSARPSRFWCWTAAGGSEVEASARLGQALQQVGLALPTAAVDQAEGAAGLLGGDEPGQRLLFAVTVVQSGWLAHLPVVARPTVVGVTFPLPGCRWLSLRFPAIRRWFMRCGRGPERVGFFWMSSDIATPCRRAHPGRYHPAATTRPAHPPVRLVARSGAQDSERLAFADFFRRDAPRLPLEPSRTGPVVSRPGLTSCPG